MNEIVTKIIQSMTDSENYTDSSIDSASGFAMASDNCGEIFIKELENQGYTIVKTNKE